MTDSSNPAPRPCAHRCCNCNDAGCEQCAKPERKRVQPVGRNTKSAKKRYDYAVDQMLNSGTMCPFIDDFWRYVDGVLTWEQYTEVAP